MREVVNNTPEQPPQDTLQENKFDRYKPLLVFGVMLGFAISGVVGYYLGLQKPDKPDSSSNTVLTPTPISTVPQPPNPSLTPLSFHYLSSDSKIYESPRLGIMFEYPRGIVDVYDCPDIPCISIYEYTIRIEPLRIYGAEKLKNDDLYCSADGPTGSTYCLNREVEAFTNANNISGYKIMRTRINEAYNPTTKVRDREEYDDRAYVFPITHPEYKAVLFVVDSPIEGNLKELDRIVETFRVTK